MVDTLRGDVPVVDTIVCMEATIQLVVMYWHTRKMDRYTDFLLCNEMFYEVQAERALCMNWNGKVDN